MFYDVQVIFNQCIGNLILIVVVYYRLLICISININQLYGVAGISEHNYPLFCDSFVL